MKIYKEGEMRIFDGSLLKPTDKGVSMTNGTERKGLCVEQGFH